ncbi:MAG: hypothetical protein MZV70_58770 [Desulfobacterales bacterium]|nr:hypothetical protein [Desulfobacterales bacterium]
MDITFTKMHGLGNDFYRHRLPGLGRPGHRRDRRPRVAPLRQALRHRRRPDPSSLPFRKSRLRDENLQRRRKRSRDVRQRDQSVSPGISGTAAFPARPCSTSRPLPASSGLSKAGDLVLVDMGEPALEPEHIPVNITASGAGGKIVDYPLPLRDREFRITCLSMGNPHAVIFIDEDLSGYPVPVYGPLIERHPLFPRRTNVEFVRVDGRTSISMRVWERGAGETPRLRHRGIGGGRRFDVEGIDRKDDGGAPSRRRTCHRSAAGQPCHHDRSCRRGLRRHHRPVNFSHSISREV